MKKLSLQLICLSLMTLFYTSAFAWEHSIELGYGRSHDPNGTKYTNSGFLLTSDLYSFWQTNWFHPSINVALARWRSTTPSNNRLTAAALSLALRGYPFSYQENYSPYLFASAGPAYLSFRKFSVNTQAKHISIQTNIGLGMEFKCIDVNFRLAHYSNANLAKPNEGFNILYMLSVGYLF